MHSERSFDWCSEEAFRLAFWTSASICILKDPSIGVLKEPFDWHSGQAFRLALWTGTSIGIITVSFDWNSRKGPFEEAFKDPIRRGAFEGGHQPIRKGAFEGQIHVIQNSKRDKIPCVQPTLQTLIYGFQTHKLTLQILIHGCQTHNQVHLNLYLPVPSTPSI